MDPTTLVTFLFKTPPHIRAVELFGSWDNFTFPYRMHHDRRRGAGCWSGCFKFENIIFDGEKIEWNRPRSGGLKQGGTYWYYYRLNYDLEAYDDLRPYTADCPLMPGQTVNVIEVPRELVRAPSRCRSAYGDLIGTLASIQEVQTLDPDRKFASVEPPPVSRFHKNSKSEDALRKKAVDQQKQQRQSLPPQHQRQQQPQQGQIRMVDSRSPPSPPHTRPRHPSISSDERSLVSADSYRSTSPESSPQSAHRRRRGPWATEPMLNTSPKSLPESPARSLVDTDEPLPTFPYPNVLGASPLSSTDELSGSLFPARSSVVSVAEHDGNSTPREGSKQVRHASSCSPIITTTSESVSMQSPTPSESTQPDSSPASVQNVQFYGSRPSSTSESPTHFRPRMYSLPTNELRDSYPSTRSASAVMTPDGIPEFHDHDHDDEGEHDEKHEEKNHDEKMAETVKSIADKINNAEASSPPQHHQHRQSPVLPSAAATAAAYATLKPPAKQSITSPPPATTTTTKTTVRNLTITKSTPTISSPPGALNYTLPPEPDSYPRHRNSPAKSPRYHRGPHPTSGNHAPAAMPTPIVVVSCADDAPSAPFSLVDEETLFFSEIWYLGGSIL